MARTFFVEPMYPVIIGSVCRVMRNFGARELWMVRPQTEISHEAVKYAKHAQDILLKARRVSSLPDALQGIDYVVGSTGVVPRFKYALKSCITPRDLAAKLDKREKIALVFGNEGTGLSLADLKLCDSVVSIPASKRYSVLNLSHAVAILLYELFAGKRTWSHYRQAKRGQVKFLEKMMSEIVGSFGEVRDKGKVMGAFER